MKLGILVNSDRHLNDILGITDAALSRGHEVIIFTMDDGTRLFENPAYTALCKRPGVRMSFCDHSAVQLGVDKAGITEDIVCGSQYNNASMEHEADRLIVL